MGIINTEQSNIPPNWGEHLHQFKEDTIFLESIRPELLYQYPDCWIAIYQKEVVGVASKLKDIIKQLNQKDVPRGYAVIEFLNIKQIPMIL